MDEVGFLLDFEGEVKRVDLAVEVEGIPARSKEWVVSVAVFSTDASQTSSQLNWYYSDAMEKNFVYVPEQYTGGLLRLRQLESSEAFHRLRLALVRVPWAKEELAENARPRIVRCRYAAHQMSMSRESAPARTIHALGEVTR